MSFRLLYSIVIITFLCACRSEKPSAPIENIKSPIKNNSTDKPLPTTNDVEPDTLKYCLVKENIGVGGYDLVNYFTTNTAQLGQDHIRSIYDNVVYHFMNEENKLAFDANPPKYLPAFGGWCSMTLAMGNATIPKFNNFRIINDKLFLFERTLSVNGQSLWMQDTLVNNKLASANYKQFKKYGIIKTEE